MDNLLSVINANHGKENIVYKNFDIGTNINVRRVIDQITNTNKIFMDRNWPQTEYLTRLSKSMFVISPPGNGIDCHRIWEALYVRTVPIVERSSAFRNFTNLPIMFIDRWEDITIDFLKTQIPLYYNKSYDLKQLKLQYWKELIRG